MRSVALVSALAGALALAACGLPDQERVRQDLQAIAEAGAPPEGVTVEILSTRRGEGDLSAFDQHVDYDLKIWRDGQLAGPLVGGVAEVRAGQRLSGGKAVIVYNKGDDGPWTLSGLMIERTPTPATEPARP